MYVGEWETSHSIEPYKTVAFVYSIEFDINTCTLKVVEDSKSKERF